jgi:type II secretory pathway component PulJ
LIELLAVVGFTAVLMLFAVNFYIEITRASEAATDRTRDSRRAIALLDRIARDLEAAVLVRKPEELDPLYHPWVFLAEDRGGDQGAERLKFTTRSRILRSTADHESDLAVVSYALRQAENGGFELLRWSSPRLPEELDRSFPASEAEGAVVFADDLASFGVTFLDDEGDWRSEWDSSTLIDSSELPLAAEISVSILPVSDSLGEEEPDVYLRRVSLPVRPLDLQALLDSKPPDEDTGCEAGGMTVGACLMLNESAYDELRKSNPTAAVKVEEAFDECFSDHSHLFGDIDLVGCK